MSVMMFWWGSRTWSRLQDLVQAPVGLWAEGLAELSLTVHELLSPQTSRALRHRASSCRLLTRAFVCWRLSALGGAGRPRPLRRLCS